MVLSFRAHLARLDRAKNWLWQCLNSTQLAAACTCNMERSWQPAISIGISIINVEAWCQCYFFRLPYYRYTITCPQNPIPIIQAISCELPVQQLAVTGTLSSRRMATEKTKALLAPIEYLLAWHPMGQSTDNMVAWSMKALQKPLSAARGVERRVNWHPFSESGTFPDLVQTYAADADAAQHIKRSHCDSTPRLRPFWPLRMQTRCAPL